MNIAIIDDSENDRNQLKTFLQTLSRKDRLAFHIQEFNSAEAFLTAMETCRWDLLFLDIYMSDMDGMTLAQEIRRSLLDPLIIFTTTSREHAIESYDVHAFYYLLKPYDYSRFEMIMRKGLETLKSKDHYIEIKEGRLMIKVLIRDINYTDYYNHYIQIHTASRVIKTYMSFPDFSPMLLQYPQFISPYRNCMINMDRVEKMEDHDFLMKDQTRIPINKNIRAQVRQAYADYAFSQLDAGF